MNDSDRGKARKADPVLCHLQAIVEMRDAVAG
jgi:hypothetical protein